MGPQSPPQSSGRLRSPRGPQGGASSDAAVDVDATCVGKAVHGLVNGASCRVFDRVDATDALRVEPGEAELEALRHVVKGLGAVVVLHEHLGGVRSKRRCGVCRSPQAQVISHHPVDVAALFELDPLVGFEELAFSWPGAAAQQAATFVICVTVIVADAGAAAMERMRVEMRMCESILAVATRVPVTRGSVSACGVGGERGDVRRSRMREPASEAASGLARYYPNCGGCEGFSCAQRIRVYGPKNRADGVPRFLLFYYFVIYVS